MCLPCSLVFRRLAGQASLCSSFISYPLGFSPRHRIPLAKLLLLHFLRPTNQGKKQEKISIPAAMGVKKAIVWLSRLPGPVKPGSILVKQAPCGDGPVKLSASKTGRKEGYGVVLQAPCSEASGKVSASTTGRKEGHGLVQQDTCSDSRVSKTDRKEGHRAAQQAPCSGRFVKVFEPKMGRKEGYSLVQQDTCSYGSVKLSASKTGRKEGHCRDGSVKVSESKTGRKDAKSSASQTPSIYGSLSKHISLGYGSVSPKTGRQEEVEVSSLISETSCEDDFPVFSVQSWNDGQSAVQHTCCTDGSALASTTEKNDGLVRLNPLDDLSDVLHFRMEAKKPNASTHVGYIQSVAICHRRSKRKTSNDALLELQQKIELLESEQVSLSDVKTLLKKRAFVSASSEQLAAVLNVLKEFCASGQKAFQVLSKNVGVLLQPVELLQQKLKVLADFQVGEEASLRLGTSMYLLNLKAEALQRRLTFLKEIGLCVKARNKILYKNPHILTLTVENSMQPTVDYLESIGMTRPRVLKLLENRPEVLAMSIDNNLMVKHKFFQGLGFSIEEFSRAIRFVSQCSNERILAQVNFIKEQGFSDTDVSEMLRKQPGILARSREGIKTRLHYLLHEQNRNITEVVKFPACLGYSLEERIIPRFNILKEMGSLRIYSLSTILGVKDSEFRKRHKVPESVKAT